MLIENPATKFNMHVKLSRFQFRIIHMYSFISIPIVFIALSKVVFLLRKANSKKINVSMFFRSLSYIHLRNAVIYMNVPFLYLQISPVLFAI